MTSKKSTRTSDDDRSPQLLIAPNNLGLAYQPFGQATAAAKKCYVVFDYGPPRILQQVDCKDIIIVHEDKVSLDSSDLTFAK